MNVKLPAPKGPPAEKAVLMQRLKTEWEEKRAKGEIPAGQGVSEYRQKRLREMGKS